MPRRWRDVRWRDVQKQSTEDVEEFPAKIPGNLRICVLSEGPLTRAFIRVAMRARLPVMPFAKSERVLPPPGSIYGEPHKSVI